MFTFVASASVLLNVLIAAESSVVVTTTGPVQGTFVQDEYASYYAYLGIPYAESPEGNLRFKPPVPKKPWTEVRDATEHGPVCPQPEGRYTRDQMSEDCLRINVLVPANRTQDALPVFMFAHGGGFKSNSGDIDIFYGPQFFLNRDIIYVSMNFRLGALGYLSLNTDDAAGNAGIKDVLLALRWINDNIHAFGGNSKAVTVGGQSSGAGIVHYLLLTERSTGLFHRAVLNSGSATNFRFHADYPKQNALALAEQLGISVNDDIENIVQGLVTADVFEIINAQESIYREDRNPMRGFAPFVPSVEKDSDHAVITEHPLYIVKAGMPQNMPILAGINAIEGAYMWTNLHRQSTETLQQIFTRCIPADIEYPRESNGYNNLVDSMTELYFGDKSLSNWTETNFYDLVSDTQYTYSVDSWIKAHKSRRDSERLYYYLFDFDGDLNWSKLSYNIEFPGAVHADEIGYLFVTKATAQALKYLSPKSQQTLNNMLTLVTNFIRFGDPTPEGYGGQIVWPESGGNRNHLVINDRPEIVSKPPFETRFNLWERAYNRYNAYLRHNQS